jgi:hypothetical protein
MIGVWEENVMIGLDFGVRIESTFSYTGVNLPDPTAQFNRLINPGVLRFPEVAENACNLFTGEPGIGKSTSLRQEFSLLRPKWRSSGASALWVDLCTVTGLADLRTLLENEIITAWLKGDHSLHLFLDSLDEALPAFPALPKAICQTLESFPQNQLRLSLICRPGEWYAYFDRILTDLWPKGVVRVYTLAPLRREDVFEAATEAGIEDVDAFLDAVAHNEAGPFAATPTTLEFLIEEFMRGGGLSAELSELYRRGCTLLCSEEYDASRQVIRRLNSDQCVILAGRIACLTEFSARPVISALAADSATSGVLPVARVTGDNETAAGESFGVGRADVVELLHRALFSAVGTRFRWAHKSYAEFLAAYYLHARNLPLRQILAILRHPLDSLGGVAPAT